ncbi:hypothetical protein LC612_44205 [Nostoc sp. CHAB 5834]|nr:hypothetical protein [Nostoc sp. CHAB 5834]
MSLVQRLPEVDLPNALRNLPVRIQTQLSASLANDETSADEEMVEFWVSQCKIEPEVANAAIQFRQKYFTNPLFELF